MAGKLKNIKRLRQIGGIGQVYIAFHAGHFSCFRCLLLTLFKINFFINFFQEHYHKFEFSNY